MTKSKAEELLEAARKRNQAEQKIAENTQPTPPPARAEDRLTDTELDGLKEKAATQAEVNVQGRAGSLTGEVDIEAMGDVKGDGGDAKNYDEGDPAKALGVPVYEHGLNQTNDGVDQVLQAAEEVKNGPTVSAATQAEMEAGRKAVERYHADREAAQKASAQKTARTTVRESKNTGD